MDQANNENTVSGMLIMDYEKESATFYLGEIKTINGKHQFSPKRKFFQEADTNYEPLRIKQLPLNFAGLLKAYPRRNDESTREVSFYMPERKFNKGARAYIRAKRHEIERKAMESNMNNLMTDDDDDTYDI